MKRLFGALAFALVAMSTLCHADGFDCDDVGKCASPCPVIPPLLSPTDTGKLLALVTATIDQHVDAVCEMPMDRRCRRKRDPRWPGHVKVCKDIYPAP